MFVLWLVAYCSELPWSVLSSTLMRRYTLSSRRTNSFT